MYINSAARVWDAICCSNLVCISGFRSSGTDTHVYLPLRGDIGFSRKHFIPFVSKTNNIMCVERVIGKPARGEGVRLGLKPVGVVGNVGDDVEAMRVGVGLER